MLEVHQPGAEPRKEQGREEKAEKAAEQAEPHVLSGSEQGRQPFSFFLADVGRHKLLTAAEEGHPRKGHRARRSRPPSDA